MEFEEWMEWTECSTTCGAGSRARRRTCKITDQDTVAECSGRLLETESCTLGPCPGNQYSLKILSVCFKQCSPPQLIVSGSMGSLRRAVDLVELDR